MNFNKTYGYTDPNKLAEWFENEQGGSFFIAPLGNPAQLEENLKRTSISETEIQEGTLYERKVETCEILANCILLDWKEVEDDNKKEIKYTAEAGAKALYSYDEFRSWVVDKAKELQQTQKSAKEETQKK